MNGDGARQTERFDPFEAQQADSSPAIAAEHQSAQTVVSPDVGKLPKSLQNRYVDVQFLGEGGMGVVFRAMDLRLGRIIALKLMKSPDAEQRQRFVMEARSQARIVHEHVCRIYETGEAEGEPYISMQFIDGKPLTWYRCRLSFEQCAQLMKRVALGVHEAHRMGIIHRDLKPANIMVEVGEDGTPKPWVMDFGLAREIHAQGQTRTGVILGTIEYMPVEQATGDVRAMDRRSDVYSLGATLYDILAGRPPFVDERPWKLLQMVGHDDVPPVSTWRKGIPKDLETIVMKCLEREQAGRYDSAKALADDLERYLDGEPILGKRASTLQVFVKKARKNKWLTAVVVVCTLGALAFTGAWIRVQHQATVRERLARELGENVKEMELFMRAAYAAPLHDIERDRDVVRARLHEIETRMGEAGDATVGPTRYALGRGYLVLDDPQVARIHLDAAMAAGYTSPDVELALGRSLGELYRRGMIETRRITNVEQRRKRMEELDKLFRVPALEHLRNATGATIESPHHAEGLIALYEGRNEEAKTKARLAFDATPWAYEPIKLEADALFAEGSKHRSDAQFDYEKMMTYFGPASEAYAKASEFARSDPEAHRAECELWQFVAYAHMDMGMDSSGAFDRATAACRRGIASSSKDARPRILLAAVYGAVANYEARAVVLGVDTARRIADALVIADDAQRAAPDDAMANYARGSAYFSDMMFRRYQGRDATASTDRAIDAYESAIRIDSKYSWAHTELLGLWAFKIAYDATRGLDLANGIARGEAIAARAIAADPDFPFVFLAEGEFHVAVGRAAVEKGQSPKEQMERAFSALQQFRQRLPNVGLDHPIALEAHVVMAEYQTHTNGDPNASIRAAHAVAQQAKESGAGGAQLVQQMGELSYVEALYALRDHRDPNPHIEEARRAFREAQRQVPWRIVSAVFLTRTEIIALRSAIAQKRATEALFDAAEAPLQSFLSDSIADPGIFATLATVYFLHADWLAESKLDPKSDIEKGMRYCEKALEINPRDARALAAKARLMLAEALTLTEANAKAERLGAAKAIFERAFKINAFLEPEHREAMQALSTIP